VTEDAALKSLRATLRTYAGAGSTQWDEWAAAPDHHPMRRAILDALRALGLGEDAAHRCLRTLMDEGFPAKVRTRSLYLFLHPYRGVVEARPLLP
jgi:hypothetical protein